MRGFIWGALHPYLVLGAVRGVLHCFSAGDRDSKRRDERGFSHERKGGAGAGGEREGESLQARACPQRDADIISSLAGRRGGAGGGCFSAGRRLLR